MKKTLIVQAPAKINIGLWVKNKRPDGFHELDTFFQTISLMDSITLHESFEEGIRVSCNNKNVPLGEDNIAFRAARIFLQKVGIEPALDIHIEKRIPMAAGLAGGSTDAPPYFIKSTQTILRSTVSLQGCFFVPFNCNILIC